VLSTSGAVAKLLALQVFCLVVILSRLLSLSTVATTVAGFKNRSGSEARAMDRLRSARTKVAAHREMAGTSPIATELRTRSDHAGRSGDF
jgi:hypothetical protein